MAAFPNMVFPKSDGITTLNRSTPYNWKFPQKPLRLQLTKTSGINSFKNNNPTIKRFNISRISLVVISKRVVHSMLELFKAATFCMPVLLSCYENPGIDTGALKSSGWCCFSSPLLWSTCWKSRLNNAQFCWFCKCMIVTPQNELLQLQLSLLSRHYSFAWYCFYHWASTKGYSPASASVRSHISKGALSNSDS